MISFATTDDMSRLVVWTATWWRSCACFRKIGFGFWYAGMADMLGKGALCV